MIHIFYFDFRLNKIKFNLDLDLGISNKKNSFDSFLAIYLFLLFVILFLSKNFSIIYSNLKIK